MELKSDTKISMSTPWGFRIRSSTSFIIFAVCIGLFTDSITASSIIPILPSALVTRAGVPEEHVQFYISAFMTSFSITFIAAAPIFGHLSDRLTSRRRPFVWGMIVNILSLLLYMKATSVIGMAIARALQGVSSSAILVIGTALVKDSVTKEKTGKGMAFTTVAIQLGLIMGPAFGGLIYDNVGYEAVFIAPAFLLAMDIVLRLLIIETPVARLWLLHHKSDSLNGNTEDGGETEPLIDPSRNTSVRDTSSTQIVSSNGKTIMDLLPVLRFFLNGRIVTALFISLLDSISWGALESTVPFFVIRTFHWTPTNAGTLFLISCTPGILLTYVVGRSIDRLGSLYLATPGLSVVAACHLSQRLVHSNTLRDKVMLTTFFTTGNAAMLFVQIAMSVEVGLAAQQIDDSLKGQGGRMVGKAYALYMMVQSFGQLLGPVIGGAMMETVGWAGMTTLLGALCLVALPCVLLFTGGGVAAWRSKAS